MQFLNITPSGPACHYQPWPVCDPKTIEVKCLSNWEEMFCILQESAPAVFQASYPFPSPMLLTHIHTRDASSANNRSGYCQLSDSINECQMIAIYSQCIFYICPGALLITLGGPFEVFTHFRYWLSVTIVEIAWTLPLSVCSKHEPNMEASVYRVSDVLF